jgi:hypothetical protein
MCFISLRRVVSPPRPLLAVAALRRVPDMTCCENLKLTSRMLTPRKPTPAAPPAPPATFGHTHQPKRGNTSSAEYKDISRPEKPAAQATDRSTIGPPKRPSGQASQTSAPRQANDKRPKPKQGPASPEPAQGCAPVSQPKPHQHTEPEQAKNSTAGRKRACARHAPPRTIAKRTLVAPRTSHQQTHLYRRTPAKYARPGVPSQPHTH